MRAWTLEIKTLSLPSVNFLAVQNYMVADLLGSLWAVLLFAFVLYAPGYVVGSVSNLFGFRKLPFTERSCWSIALSFGVAPLLAWLLGRTAGLHTLVWFFAAAVPAALLLSWRQHHAFCLGPHPWRNPALVLVGWTALCLLLLVDAQAGKRLFFSVVTADQSYRIAFTEAVVRSGLPPANPLYYAGSSAPMPYFYFWYVLCAVIVKLAHVSARQAFIASSVWAGFGLLVTVRLYSCHFFRWQRRQRWVAVGLLLVTGADLLPALGQAMLQPSLNGDTEWWSVDPIDGWPDSLLWVPHHVAGVLCSLLALLLLWRTRELLSSNDRRWAIGLAVMAFASAFGLSVYVAFGFSLLISAWWLFLMVAAPHERRGLGARIPLAALLSAALLLPFLHELRANAADSTVHRAGTHAAPPLLSLSVRRMIDSELITSLPFFEEASRSHPVLLDGAIRLLLLLPGLAMELGLYGAVLVLLLLRRRHSLSRTHPPADDPAHRTSLFFVIAGLLMTMFLSSSVISNNDFGYRAIMLPQFFLLLLTAEVLGSSGSLQAHPILPLTPGRVRLLHVLVGVGVAGTLYWAVLLRAWLPLETRRPQDGFTSLPEDAFQIRKAFAALDQTAPVHAVVAFRPLDAIPKPVDEVMAPNEFYQRLLVMDTGRQMLNAEGKCATHFGGDARACPAIRTSTAQLYATPAPDADWARAYCLRFRVQYLVLSTRDPGWDSTSGWPATLPLVATESRIRIFRCH